MKKQNIIICVLLIIIVVGGILFFVNTKKLTNVTPNTTKYSYISETDSLFNAEKKRNKKITNIILIR